MDAGPGMQGAPERAEALRKAPQGFVIITPWETGIG